MKWLLTFIMMLMGAASFADIATTPANFSCDEMYYSYYYDYEKLRQVYDRFNRLDSACNKPVLDWLVDEETGSENGHYRTHLSYAIENKEELFDQMKALFDIDPSITVEDLKNPEVMKELIEQASLPKLITNEDIKKNVGFEIERLRFFAEMERKNLNHEKYDQLMSFLQQNFEREWIPPVLGQGAGSTKMKGYYRIDLLGEPIDLSKAWDMKCAKIYRGFGNSCEQDCSYMRNVAIDVQAKMRLWQQEWDWENHKMLCTPQSKVKGSVMPFDAPFCRLSCPGGEVECSTCSYKVTNDQQKPHAVTCLSEYDAKHAADLFCYLNGNAEGCAEVTCNKSYNIHQDIPDTITAHNEYTEAFSKEHTIGFETKASLQGGPIEAGVEVSGDVKLGVSGSLHLYSKESATLIDKFLTERSDGKLFECPQELAQMKSRVTCEDLDAANPRYEKETSCGQDKDGRDFTFGACEPYKMGEGRAFFNCTISIDRIKSLSGKGYVGKNLNGKLPIIGGGQLEVYGNTQHGFDLMTIISAQSKEFNAGGLSLEHMKATCDRWQDQWLTVTLGSHAEDSWIMNLDPMSHFEPQQQLLPTEEFETGSHVSCTIKDPNGTTRRAQIAAIETKVSMVPVSDESESAASQARKKKVFEMGFVIKEKMGNWGRLSDYLATDSFYPVAAPPLEKEYFQVDYDNRHLQFLTGTMQNNMTPEMIAEILEELTPARKGPFEIRNCEVVKRSKKRKPGRGHSYKYKNEVLLSK